MNSHMQNIKLDHSLSHYKQKSTEKWTKDLAVRQAVKYIGENTGKDFMSWASGCKREYKQLGLHQTRKLLLYIGRNYY